MAKRQLAKHESSRCWYCRTSGHPGNHFTYEDGSTGLKDQVASSVGSLPSTVLSQCIWKWSPPSESTEMARKGPRTPQAEKVTPRAEWTGLAWPLSWGQWTVGRGPGSSSPGHEVTLLNEGKRQPPIGFLGPAPPACRNASEFCQRAFQLH